MAAEYATFLDRKSHSANEYGFDPATLPSWLFDFQRDLVAWALRKGRAAIFADCGLGKTPMYLAWADAVTKHEDGRVLVLTPIAVGFQAALEAAKFGIECHRSEAGEFGGERIVIANYERLHYFDPSDFVGVVVDESSILKSYDGARRGQITDFVRKMPYRLLDTATAAPNDYIELGTSSEALGELGHMDMLARFFKNDLNNASTGRGWGEVAKWRFKGHAEVPFWRWVTSWARAIRRPSDLGYDAGRFILPPLVEREHLVDVEKIADGMLFNLPAVGLKEQRDERRRSISERCQRVAELVAHDKPALVWCHLNDEGDALESLIADGEQVSGSDSDDDKEAKFLAFARGDLRVLITKPKIGAWGLNFQHCAHVTFFPSHSFEQYYQGVRRCWRFGQTREVIVDVVTTEGERGVMKNLQRKATQADTMFSALVREMNAAEKLRIGKKFTQPTEVPAWL
jgi:hypothetical protein